MNSEYLKVARIASAAGAAELLKHRTSFSVHEKAPRDLVTEADIASQRAISNVLLAAFPDHHFVGEEEGHDQVMSDALDEPDHPPVWIVDPLDGTVNYVHQLQGYAVSIALLHRQQLQIGLVHDPISHEIYWAQRNQGAYLNDAPICSSKTTAIRDALLACSFSIGAGATGDEMARFSAVLERAQSIRRLGSAALNLCYVAAGRLDGYWATSVKPWDVAAGALIVQEAGGTIQSIDGCPFQLWQPKFAATATDGLSKELLSCF